MAVPVTLRRARGFTLIEVAIVLVVIGLLLGGILRAQELITQAQVRSVATELQATLIAHLVYTDRYRQLAGDDPGAFDRWGGGVAAGDGNRRIDGAFASQTPDDESRLFWAHLRAAGLVAGAGQDQPFNALRGIVGVQTGDGAGGTVLGGRGWLLGCSSNLPGRIAIAIDSQFDDGDMTHGALLGQEQAGAAALQTGPVSGAYRESVEQRYIVCRRF